MHAQRFVRSRRGVALTAGMALACGAILALGQPGSAHGAVSPVRASTSADARLTAQLADARLATAKYATNLAAAKSDGYQIITQMIPNMGYHYLNPTITGFDVRKPPILVYEHRGDDWQLGALEWVFTTMPKAPPLANATFGFFPAACH